MGASKANFGVFLGAGGGGGSVVDHLPTPGSLNRLSRTTPLGCPTYPHTPWRPPQWRRAVFGYLSGHCCHSVMPLCHLPLRHSRGALQPCPHGRTWNRRVDAAGLLQRDVPADGGAHYVRGPEVHLPMVRDTYFCSSCCSVICNICRVIIEVRGTGVGHGP